MVQNATTLVLQGLVQQTETSDPHDTDLALQPLFDLMTDAGLEWPSSLLVDSTATPTGWGCGITL